MAHIQILISTLCVFGIAHLIWVAGQSSVGASTFHAAVWISLLLYAGALIGVLSETALFLRLIGGVGLVLLVIRAIRQKITLTLDQVFIVFSVITFYLLCNTPLFITFSQVDDFTHWGRVSRFLTEDNALLTQPVGVPDYPPIAALFQYFFMHFSGFEDRLAIFSQGVIVISAAGILLDPVNTYPRSIKTIAFFITALVIYSLSWILFTGLGTLQVDLLLGISFGLVFITYFCRQPQSTTRALFFSTLPAALFIVLLKPIGMLFASIALGAVSLAYLRTTRPIALKITVVSLLFLAMLIGYLSWKQFLYQKGIGETFSFQKVTVTNVFDAITNNADSSRQSLTIRNFGRYLFLSVHPSTYWFFVCVLTALAVFKLSRITSTKVSLIPCFTLFGGFAAYLLILLVLYMYSFTEYEGTRLASFERYTITYLLGILIFLGGQLVYLIGFAPISRSIRLCLLGIALLYAGPNILYFVRYTVKVLHQPNYLYVNKVANIAEEVVSKTPSSSKIYFIYSDGSNDESNVFHYLIHPRHSNRDCSSIKPPNALHSTSDPWACTFSIDQLKSRLMEYDFVVFAQTSNSFLSYYALPLNIQSHNKSQIYSVSSQSGALTLRPLQAP